MRHSITTLAKIVEGMHRLRGRLGAKWCVVGLLIPPALFGIYHFGPRAAIVIGLSVVVCLAAGIVPRLFSRQPFELLHAGTIITGLLLGLTLSAQTPLYMIVIGALVATLPGKFKLRWLDRNPFNPAALGRTAVAVLECLDTVSHGSGEQIDIATGPSALFKEAGGHARPALTDIFLGFQNGAIGETSDLILIAVGILMFWFVVIKHHAALTMIVTVPLLVICLPAESYVVGHAPWVLNPLVYLLGGNTLLLAIYFATDPTTIPKTRLGGILFGVGVGALGVLGRVYTAIPGVEMYVILIMNLAVPVLDWRPLAKPRRRANVRSPIEPSFVNLLARSNGSRSKGSDAPRSGAVHGVRTFFEQAERPIDDADVPDVARLSRITSLPDRKPFSVFKNLVAAGERKTVLDAVQASGLCGCGGARFPVHLKWKAVLKPPGPRVLIANGQEGEPETFKDRFLMQHHTRLVVEGIAIAAFVLEPEETIIVVTARCSGALQAMTNAVAELEQLKQSATLPRIRIVPGPDLYVCGEETALIEFLESHRGEPRLRPPLPVVSGLHGRPTLVQNIETLAWLPSIVHHGAEWFRGSGSDDLPGGFQLVSLTVAVKTPGVYEVQTGTALKDIVAMGGGLVADQQLLAIAVGGPSGGLLPPSQLDLPFEPIALKKAGTMMGTGAVRVLGVSDSLVNEALFAARFFRDESCGRCTPCRVGTSELVRLWQKLADGEGGEDELMQLREIAAVMRQTSTCGLGMAAAARILSVIDNWPEHFERCLSVSGERRTP